MSFLGFGQNAHRVVEAKTAAYQMDERDLGKIFTNRGAGGSVTLTLPVVTSLPSGWWVEFFQVADQNLVIASQGSSDNIVGHNDAGLDTITSSTAGDLIGTGGRLVWDGTGWLYFPMQDDGVTITLA